MSSKKETGGMKNTIKNLKKNPWTISTIILSVVIIVLLFASFGGSISKSDAGDIILNFANSQTGGGVELVEINEKAGLYEVMVSYNGQDIPLYLTKDGENLVQSLTPLESIPSNAPTAPQNTEVVEVSIDDDAVKGEASAPVTIIEFSDYECPFCGRYYEQTLPQIISEYVNNGKVKIVFRDFPLGFHSKAQKAGEAAECAGEQGKYWAMHDKLFDNQGSLDVDDLKTYAGEIGLNTAQFDTCLDSGKMADEIAKDMSDGQSYGVKGTPAFFINGRFLSGAQPFSAFKQIIDEELAK